MQCTEEITKKSIDGERKSYMARGGPPGSSTEVEVSKIDGLVFPTADAAKEHLVRAFTQKIDAMITQAARKAVEWYGQDIEPQRFTEEQLVERESIPVPSTSAFEGETFTLPDGTVARVRNVIGPDQVRLGAYLQIMKTSLKEYVRLIIEAKIAASASYMKKELVREKVQALIVQSVADGTIKTADDLAQFSKDIELSMNALKMIPFEVWQKMSGTQKKARKLAMKTSAEWWAGIKSNEKKFNAWLVKQHRGEVTAATRITQFAEKYATDVKHKALLGKIAEQEAQHATWVEGLLHRGESTLERSATPRNVTGALRFQRSNRSRRVPPSQHMQNRCDSKESKPSARM